MADRSIRFRWIRWSGYTLAIAIGYVVSSGPVMAALFWLREKTDWDGFYTLAFGFYFPLIWVEARGTSQLSKMIHLYIDWWVGLLGTVGPG